MTKYNKLIYNYNDFYNTIYNYVFYKHNYDDVTYDMYYINHAQYVHMGDKATPTNCLVSRPEISKF